MKLYAYSDDDGYIHWNVLEGQSIWCNHTKSWLKREKHMETAYKKELGLRIALLGAWTAFFLALFLQGKL
jgi:hypothetical protein